LKLCGKTGGQNRQAYADEGSKGSVSCFAVKP